MDSKLLILFGSFVFFQAVFAEDKKYRCYECDRWQVGILNGGEDHNKCKDPVGSKAPESEEECYACRTDSRDKLFGWVERKCIKEKDKCKPGTVSKSFIDILDLSDATEYDVERECCKGNLCNRQYFDTSASVSMRTSYILFAVVLLFFYIRF